MYFRGQANKVDAESKARLDPQIWQIGLRKNVYCIILPAISHRLPPTAKHSSPSTSSLPRFPRTSPQCLLEGGMRVVTGIGATITLKESGCAYPFPHLPWSVTQPAALMARSRVFSSSSSTLALAGEPTVNVTRLLHGLRGRS